ncbi:MAG: hypothetical protein ACHWZW_02960 [Spirulina sp.]
MSTILLSLGSINPALSHLALDPVNTPEFYMAQNNIIMQINGSLEQGDSALDDNVLFDEYYFDGMAGQQIFIVIENNASGGGLMVFSPDNQFIASVLNPNGGTSYITLMLPRSGEYSAVVAGRTRNSQGRYSFTITDAGQDYTPPRSSSTFNLARMPDGIYKFELPPSPHLTPEVDPVLVIQKRGSRVVGFTIVYMADNPCLSGIVSGNLITQAVWGHHISGSEDFEVSSSDYPINLSDYRLLSNQITENERDFLQLCLNSF